MRKECALALIYPRIAAYLRVSSYAQINEHFHDEMFQKLTEEHGPIHP